MELFTPDNELDTMISIHRLLDEADELAGKRADITEAAVSWDYNADDETDYDSTCWERFKC